MSSAHSADVSSLSVAAARRIDAACDRLEVALRAGQPWRWEEYLGQVEDSEHPALLRQLLLLEWEYRYERGDPFELTDYLARFPEHATLIHQVSEEHTIETGAPPAAALLATVQQDWEALGYTIISPLGRGGMGTVYLACQTAADRLVALKVLHRAPDNDPGCIDRFRREARTLARLQHPHIVPVFEVGENQGRPFYSMEYCPGGNLAEYLRDKRLLPHEAAALLEILARAVHAAHQAQVIHRDLKPSNVLLQKWFGSQDSAAATALFADSQIPKLADFGLAKNLDSTAQTQTGAMLGTPQYMAPEQARGESKAVGAAADVYALGAILYECLTGRPPFLGTSLVDTVLQVIAADVVPPTRLQPTVPRDLETICLKCLRKEPERRYADASALAEDLRRFRDGKPILARRIGAAERMGNWGKRHPVATALLVVLVLCSMVTVALAGWVLNEQDKAVAAQSTAVQHWRQAERQTALAMYEQALTVGDQKDAAGSMLWLGRSLRAAVRAEAKDVEESIRMQLGAWRRDLRPMRSAIGHRDKVIAVSYSPDGRTLLTGSQDKTAQLWDIATGTPRGPPLKHRDTVFAVDFSPDGSLVLTGSADHTARLWDVATGTLRDPPLEHRKSVYAVDFSPDGRLVLTGSGDHTAQVWDSATGKPLGPPLEHQDRVLGVAFSPDGTKVLTGSHDKTAKLWETVTGKPVGPPLEHQDIVRAVAFSPDGKTILTGCDDATAQLWETATGKPLGRALQHSSKVFTVAFSPDGNTLLTGSTDRTVRLWDAATGQPLGLPLLHQDEVRTVTFSPDGKTVLTECFDCTTRFWEMSKPTLFQHRDAVRAATFSSDGTMLATGSLDGRARLWNVATSELQGAPLRHRGAVFAAAFSPNGNLLLTGCADKTARLWNAITSERVGPPLEHRSDVRTVAFSPNGKTLLTGSIDKTAQLWDAATGVALGPPLLHQDEVCSVAFSPDGTLVLTGCWDKTAQLWATATGKRVGPPLQHLSAVVAVAFSPNGKTILTGTWDKSAHLWDAVTGKSLGSPLQHQDAILGVAFSPDGKTILTGSSDKTARLWELATGKRLGLPLQHEEAIEAVAFSPNGKAILTGSWDGTARLWENFPSVQGDPERIILWTQVITGMELDEHGTRHWLDAATWNQRHQELERLGAQAAGDGPQSTPVR